jgi:predicted permease
MGTVIAITLPIFLVVGLGFATTKAGLFSAPICGFSGGS